MIIDFCILLIGLTLLLYSAEKMIVSADTIAKKFKLSPVLIGLTIVAFGTSAPEIVITLFAATKAIPATDAITGNIIGSNVANILLILGTSALFFNINLDKIGTKDIVYLITISLYFSVLFYIGQAITLFHTIGFLILMLFYINFLRNYKSSDQEEDHKTFKSNTYLILVSTFIGIFIGGKIFLDSSLNIFQALGVNEVLIGVFVLAIGTSLPELITVIISYLKKKGSIGIGNIIGSNIMNVLFVFLPGIVIVQMRGLEYSLKNIDVFHINILILVTLMIALMAVLKVQMKKIHSLFFLLSYFLYLGYSFI